MKPWYTGLDAASCIFFCIPKQDLRVQPLICRHHILCTCANGGCSHDLHSKMRSENQSIRWIRPLVMSIKGATPPPQPPRTEDRDPELRRTSCACLSLTASVFTNGWVSKARCGSAGETQPHLLSRGVHGSLGSNSGGCTFSEGAAAFLRGRMA